MTDQTSEVIKYPDKAMEYLKNKDKILGVEINRVGRIYRPLHTDLFEALVSSIVAQQISNKAYETIYGRFQKLTPIEASDIAKLSIDQFRSCGISQRKASYILGISDFFIKEDIEKLKSLPDEELTEKLMTLKGVGRWTAEMLLIFSLNRLNIFPKDDIAMQKGLVKLHHKKSLNKNDLLKYEKRHSPYGSVASLYIWKIASE
jgi:3-methyladenine DNA glycosylase/8-oxoguanine DNA glycosylase